MSSYPLLKNPNQANQPHLPALLGTASSHRSAALAAFLGLTLTALTWCFPASAEAGVTASVTSGNLTEILNANGDVSVLSTTSSGADFQVVGTGLVATPFNNISNIAVLFGAANQTATFDSSA
ncbi:MAG TPA: hypothetical protein VGL72_16985, partial [Bryobacteraceae bacterium]